MWRWRTTPVHDGTTALDAGLGVSVSSIAHILIADFLSAQVLMK
jgi:hypothetical protein